MDGAVFGVHNAPAAFGLDLAHADQALGQVHAHPGAVGYLIEAVRSGHGTDLHRLEQDVVTRISGHGRLLVGCSWVSGGRIRPARRDMTVNLPRWKIHNFCLINEGYSYEGTLMAAGLDIKVMRMLVAIDRHGSLTRAAQALGITQSAL